MIFSNRIIWILIAGAAISACSQESTIPVSAPASESPASEYVESGSPDLSGIWQVMNTASWNLEGHTASKMPVTTILGALGGIPAGMSWMGGQFLICPMH